MYAEETFSGFSFVIARKHFMWQHHVHSKYMKHGYTVNLKIHKISFSMGQPHRIYIDFMDKRKAQFLPSLNN